jgi:hypothetical protein
MTRVLLIDQGRVMTQQFLVQCLERGLAVVTAESVCEGVRVLAATPVSTIVVDHGRLRLGVPDQAALFDRVAPGVPVLVTAGPEVPLETRVTLELGGFHLLPSLWEPADLAKVLSSN